MRGKDRREVRQHQHRRITPAYAGKRISAFLFLVHTQDHPRLCGEKIELVTLERQTMGSPPPMRGKAAALDHAGVDTGITPAYAGKSPLSGM